MDHDLLVRSIGGTPYTRRTECAKTKFSQSDFSNWKESAIISKKVIISRDLVLILAEYKNGRNMQNFQIVPDRRRIETNLKFKGFRYTRNKISKCRTYYRWVDSDCKAKLTTNISKNLIIFFDEYRSHEPDRQFIAENKFRELSFEIVLKHPTESLKIIYEKNYRSKQNCDFFAP